MMIGKIKLFETTYVGSKADPLLIRYILIRFPRWGVYLHKLCRSDYDRALHDHPWPFISIILKGSYVEVHDQTTDGRTTYEPHHRGDILIRPAEWRHRFILDDTTPTWTLVIVGRRARKWGFFLPDGWCWWRQHDAEKNICSDEILWTSGSD